MAKATLTVRGTDCACDPGKGQAVRIADVVLIGPIMVVGGAKLGGPLGAVLAVLGIGTAVYNGRNYLRFRSGGSR